MSVEYYDDSLDSTDCAPSPQYARISFYDQTPYLMQKERVIIGRNSAAGSVDIDVGAVTFVSRKHLELTYSYQKLKVKCLGKNGIFIDNNFKSHSFIPYELPPKCTLRFPSTDVQFCVEQLVGIKSADRLRPYGRLKSNIRYITDNDESPNYKRMKMNSRSEQDSTSNDNQEGGFQGFREVICNLTDNEVEEYIHNEDDEDDVRKINNSDCDGLMNDGSGENDGVLIDNIGSYSFDANGLINTSKEYSIENIKSNEINSTNILRGIDNQSSVSTRPSVTKLVFNNIHCSNDQYFSNEGQIAVLEQDDLTIEHGSDTQKPPYSYAQLIVQAVSTARDRQLTLNGIYNYISKNYPYFKAHDKGWQNSVRHNLSLNRYFIKVPRGQDEPGKGSFWRVDPTYESKLIAQAFRKRRLRNNTTSIVNENGMVSQVLNVSNIDSSSQSSNTKLFGINKSCHLTSNRTGNFGNVITLKRASDMNTQSGGTTYMLSSGSGITSNGEPQKYIVSNRNNNNSNFESLSNVSSNKAGSIFKCQSSKSVFIDGNNIKISGTSNVSSKNRPVQIRSQGNNSGTLISLGGRLFSTANIKSLQIQQQSQPRIINNTSFESSISTKASTITNTINPKGNNYYIISPSGLKNQKSLNSSYEENNSVQSQISLAGSTRRIISIQTSHSPNIHKIDLSNGNMNKDCQLKSPIIFKKIKINNNFISLKSPEPKGTNEITSRFTIRSCEKSTYIHNTHEDNLSDDDIKLEPDSHVFMSDRDIDNSEMDHFLISHSDPSVSALPLQERSEPGSSPDLYKHDDDDIWPEDEVKSLKYTSIHDDGIVDGECD